MGIVKKIISAFSKVSEKGKAIKGEDGVNSYFYHIKEYEDEEEAGEIFYQQKEKLLNVENWTKLSDIENLAFHSYDGNGSNINRKTKIGDFVKVDLPGPMPDYWVRVENITNEPDKVEVVLRPTYDPTKRPLEKEVTAHFFDRDTLNIITFEKDGKKLSAEVRGISAVVNNQGTEAGEHEIINTTVAVGGWLGLQKRQWESFTKNLAEPQSRS
jgi:hypothetical protein